MQTVYVPVQASNVNTLSVIPSGADTTSGYYLSYEVTTGIGGGFTGHGWCLGVEGNPFEGFEGIKSEQDIVDYYNSHGESLDDVFSSWITRVGDVNVSDFCNKMMHGAFYTSGCIVMAK